VRRRRTWHTRTIRAAVLRVPGGPLVIEQLELDGPRDDEVLVRLVASGICRTDIDLCEAGISGAAVLGHEGAGIVDEIGKSVRGVKRGDHVVLSYQSCGHCRPCNDGHPAHCRHFWDLNFGFRRLDGSNALQASGVRGHFFGQSSFATHALATTRNLVKVAKTLPLDLLAPLGCGLQTGAGTVLKSLAVEAGASVAIFGTGTVGLAAVMAARIVGAAPIARWTSIRHVSPSPVSSGQLTASTTAMPTSPGGSRGSPAAGSIMCWRSPATPRSPVSLATSSTLGDAWRC
jgi:aryl-alcohol dehydrogenase